jgi:ribonuclease P protein component
VFKQAARSADRYFTVLAGTGVAGQPRLGLAVSRKAAPRAVDRNRIKRLARESFRQAPRLPAGDVVVIARPAARTADSSTLRTSLERHWQRLARRNENNSFKLDG